MTFIDTLSWHREVTAELIDQVFTIDDGVVVTDEGEQHYAAASAAAFHTYRAESGDDQNAYLLTTRADLTTALTVMATTWRL